MAVLGAIDWAAEPAGGGDWAAEAPNASSQWGAEAQPAGWD